MILGFITGLEAIVPLAIFDSAGHLHEIGAILDTGSVGLLTLPERIVQSFDLPVMNRQLVTLAGGVQRNVNVYEAVVQWGNEEMVIEVLAMNGKSLLGMSMVRGKDVRFQVEEGGLVEIDDL
jgi:clan AA aspartic protease